MVRPTPHHVRPISHNEDPITSKRAEDAMRAYGKLGKQMKAVYWYVERHPDSSASQLALYAALDSRFSPDPTERKMAFRRRLSDLKSLGLIAHSLNRYSNKEVRWYDTSKEGVCR